MWKRSRVQVAVPDLRYWLRRPRGSAAPFTYSHRSAIRRILQADRRSKDHSHRYDDITDLDLALVGLPSYSPELNLAERLFEEIRRHVEGRIYANLDDKAADVRDFLEQLDADPIRVRRLRGWDWINTAIASLPAPLANTA